jgi:2-methylaconitate cis-trans-isomerase PrpF
LIRAVAIRSTASRSGEAQASATGSGGREKVTTLGHPSRDIDAALDHREIIPTRTL